MKKILFFLFLFCISTNVFAAWRMNPHTGRLDYYEPNGSSGGAPPSWTKSGGNVYTTTSTDNVGIGTASPTAKLDVISGSGKVFSSRRTDVFDSVQSYIQTTSGSSVAGWADLTEEAGKSRGTATGDILGEAGDYFYVGSTVPFGNIYIDIATAKSASGSSTFQYSTTGGGWTTLTPVVDGTTNLTVDGAITFTPPGDWTAEQVVGAVTATLYWVRIGHTGATFSTEPTIYLAVPSDGEFSFNVYGNKNDTVRSLSVDASGNVKIGNLLGGESSTTLTLAGALTMNGALSSATTGGFSSTVTSTQNLTATPTAAFTATNTTASLVGTTFEMSPSVVWAGTAWNTTPTAASKVNSIGAYLMPVSGATTSAYLNFANITKDGTADTTQIMALTTAGNVGIGTTTPNAKLVVNGTAGAPSLGSAAGLFSVYGVGTDVQLDFGAYPASRSLMS